MEFPINGRDAVGGTPNAAVRDQGVLSHSAVIDQSSIVIANRSRASQAAGTVEQPIVLSDGEDEDDSNTGQADGNESSESSESESEDEERVYEPAAGQRRVEVITLLSDTEMDESEGHQIVAHPPIYHNWYKAFNVDTPFVTKVAALRANCRPPSVLHGRVRKPKIFRLSVQRGRLVDSTLAAFSGSRPDGMHLDGHTMRCRWNVKFEGEFAVDAGGPLRAYIQEILLELCSPKAGLFEPMGDGNVLRLQYDVVQKVQWQERLKLLGLIVGKAIFEGLPLPVRFATFIIKYLLGVKVTVDDIEPNDKQLYDNIRKCGNFKVNELYPDEEVYFTIEVQNRNKRTFEREMCAGGKKRKLTDETMREYHERRALMNIEKLVLGPTRTFVDSVRMVVPQRVLKIFTDEELGRLISGSRKIDVSDWKQSTAYGAGWSGGGRHPTIRWFWSVVEKFNQKELGDLLEFCHGSRTAPQGGMSQLVGGPFTIAKHWRVNAFPASHTCTNTIDLPPYSSLEKLRERLLEAISTNASFGRI